MDKNVTKTFEQFYKQVANMHKLQDIPFTTWYTDQHNDLLPINNDDNLNIALSQALNHAAKPLLRLFVQRKGKLIISAFCRADLFEYLLLAADGMVILAGGSRVIFSSWNNCSFIVSEL